MPPPIKIRIVCYASPQFAKSRFVPDHVDVSINYDEPLSGDAGIGLLFIVIDFWKFNNGMNDLKRFCLIL